MDEVGYIPFEAEAANLFFQLVSSRYERASLIVTSNKPFGRWGEVFGDDTCPVIDISWPASDELEERIAAIGAVGEVYQANAYILEHLLVALVEFLDRGKLSRQASVAALLGFISAEPPPRPGAVEAVEFVAGALGWEELKEGLEKLRDSENAYYVNRDLARSALEAFDPRWRGGTYRTFKYRRATT